MPADTTTADTPPADAINQLSDASHPIAPARPENDALKAATDSTPSVVRPKARTTRPRPCFDDGSLTRVFKFPSKTYPRSTYYVTGSEIIIRIKKARKKWKLVVPKKRVASYRTNRWFAKPRWIELELTFTQASRLSLVEPRKQPKEPVVDAPAEPQVTSDGVATTEAFVASGAMMAPEPVDPFDGRIGLELEAEGDAEQPLDDEPSDFNFVLDLEVEPPEQQLDDDEADPDLELDAEDAPLEQRLVDDAADPDLELDAEVDTPERRLDDDEADLDPVPDHSDERRRSIPQVTDGGGGTPEPSATCSPRFEFDAADRHPVPVVVTGPLHCGKPESATGVFLGAGLAVLLVCVPGTWLTLRELPVSQTADAPMCLRSAAAAPCADAIITGAIEAGDSRHGQHPVVHGFPDSATSSAPPPESVVATKVLEHDAPEMPEPSEGPSESPDGGPEARSPGTDSGEPILPNPAVTDRVPSPPAGIAASQSAPPHEDPLDPHVCRELAFAAQSLNIRFDYASPHLDRAILTSLAAFAVRLQSCPSVMVTIEGHTDSDGHEYRNEALSRRRADAVRERLVAAGAKWEQLAVIGFGQSRPYLPNVSTENKRTNRRAVLVVEHPP